MGYFKRKRSRSRCAQEKGDFLDSGAGAWANAPLASQSPPKIGYLRLAVAPRFEGIFQSAYELRRERNLTAEELQSLTRALEWFERNLNAHAPAEEMAVFWFKSDARKFISTAWQLVRILKRHGRDVRMLTTRQPGRVVYEDRYQIAMVPHRDVRTAVKMLPDQ
jgi:hypothetical protein